MQSFNRPNLRYAIVGKTKTVDEDIRTFVSTYYKQESGIVYCTSRSQCESISTKLNAMGLKTQFYHAGWCPTVRIARHFC